MRQEEITQFIEYLDKVHLRTLRIVDSIPEAQIDWLPKPGAFSLGDLVRHVAATKRWLFAENALGNPSRYVGCGQEYASSLEEVRQFLATCHDDTLGILKALSEAQWNNKCVTPAGAAITVWKWVRLMAEHEIHHRGQLYTYLSMLDVETPPIYGLTSEQVAERASLD